MARKTFYVEIVCVHTYEENAKIVQKKVISTGHES